MGVKSISKKKTKDVSVEKKNDVSEISKGSSGSKKKLRWNTRCMLCLLPSILGLIVFFLVPFARVLYYSVINNQFQRKFVWFDNYVETLSNEFFQLAMKNSLLLIAVGVSILLVLAIVLSFLLSFGLKKFSFLRDAFIFPMLVPTAAVVLVWQQFFSGLDSVLPVYLLFIWKNIGICIILLTSAITIISPEIYEAARMDGAGAMVMHWRLTLPIIAPAVFFTVLLSIMNSFRIFKESFLYFGTKYPPDYGYTLQFYLNNNFLKFDYQTLASSSVLTALLVLAIVAVGFRLQKRYEV